MIRDEPHLEELSNAVSAGFLAEEAVFAAGQLIRGEALGNEGRATLAQAAALLRAATSPEPVQSDAPAVQQLVTADSTLDALHAARVQAPTQDLHAHLVDLVAVLERASKGEDVSNAGQRLDAIQTLFVNLGHFTLARANKLSRTREERLTWTTSTETSGS